MRDSLKKIVDNICDFLDKRNDKAKKRLDSIEQKIQDLVTTVDEKFDKSNSSIEEILEYLKAEVKESNEEIRKVNKKKNEAENSLKEKETELESLEKINNKLDANIESLRIEKSNLERNHEDLEKDLKSKLAELKQSEEKVTELSPFKEVFMSDKIMNLLNSLLENPTLKEYREEKKIINKDAQSILNLLLKLNDAKLFVDSYYENLEKYKKEHQEEMTSEETNFYKAINLYFDEEFINNPTQTKVEEEFDKKRHRGIDGESKGEINNGIILIPSDEGNNEKIKVKLK